MATKQTVDAPDMESLKAELKAAMLEEMKEQLRSEVKAEVKAEAAKANEAEAPYQETEEEKTRAEELVSLKLFKDKDRYKDDVIVIVNGKSWQIQRGVEVQVPRKVANALALADDQTGAAADVINGYEELYEEKKAGLA